MQALEAAEQAVGIGHVNADTVVGAWPRPGRVKTLMFSLCGAREVFTSPCERLRVEQPTTSALVSARCVPRSFDV
jgi:hypothetical protein